MSMILSMSVMLVTNCFQLGPGRDSTAQSFTGSNEFIPLRKILEPSKIEAAAVEVMKHVRFADNMFNEDDHHPPVGSFGRLLSSTDDGSCRSAITSTSNRHPSRAETWRNTGMSGISLLQQVARSGISAVQRPEEWVMIHVTVDSGACVTVMPSGLCPGITIVENGLCKRGVEYEVANGESIANLGERRCEVMTIGSMIPKRIVFQIAGVHKPLLSITACPDMGYDCYMGKEGGSLRDRVTGEVIPLERRGSLYTLKMWFRQAADGDNGQRFAGPG